MRPGIRKVGVIVAVGLMLVAVSPARGLVWSVQPTPFSPGIVSGVSCVSARFCTAVGTTDENVGPTAGTTAMGWDGRRWRIQPTPDPDPANEALRADNTLAGVSCTSSKVCVAVGEYNPSSFSPDGIHTVLVAMPLAERWNGVRWSLLTFPSLPSGARAGGLSAVSCTSSRICMAVGSSTDFSPLIMFAERWDGTSWSAESMPKPVGATYPFVSGLSCTSSTFCTAVGSYLGAGPDQPFAERWDGSAWSLEPLPQVAAPVDTELSSVSCTSPSACIAVGQYSTFPFQGTYKSLAERWDGTSWSVQSARNASGGFNELAGVSCTSSRACTAVGDTNHQQPLVERWDGTNWSLERTPSAGGTRLAAVSCTSSAICTAVSNTVRGNDVAEQSAPAGAKLSGIPVPCASARFTLHVTGIGISSVAWSLDSKRLKGHSVNRATRYLASVRLSPGRHKLTVRVKFTAASQAHARTFRRSVLGCSPTR
jgi:hypothetical protein